MELHTMPGYPGDQVDPVRKFQINIENPRYNQRTFRGRAKHFFIIANPLNVFVSDSELNRCATIVQLYRSKQKLPDCVTVDELWRAKNIYDSAFHPETGEKMPLLGRMSAQMPANTLITAFMLVFYKTTYSTIFWQWVNQSFNALVNYTNRSGKAKISDKQLATSYVCATTGAVATALAFKNYAKKAPPIVARLVPFTAVAAANMVNIPCMRAQELKHGLVVVDDRDRPLGHSKIVAQKAISAVVISRIFMAIPGMFCTPFIMNSLERRGTFCRYPWLNFPLQCGLIAFCLTFATPLGCAIFTQRAGIEIESLEPRIQRQIECMKNPPNVVYYNKGL